MRIERYGMKERRNNRAVVKGSGSFEFVAMGPTLDVIQEINPVTFGICLTLMPETLSKLGGSLIIQTLHIAAWENGRERRV